MDLRPAAGGDTGQAKVWFLTDYPNLVNTAVPASFYNFGLKHCFRLHSQRALRASYLSDIKIKAIRRRR